MKDSYYKDIKPESSDICQPTSMLEIDDPFLLAEGGAPILFGTLRQKDAAKAAYGTDRSFFCYVGADLTEWAGPYLLCENPIDAEEYSAPKLIRIGKRVLLFGKFRTENKTGIVIFRADSPLGKFKFVSAFRLNADFAPFLNPNGRISLICTENGDLVRRELSENLMRLSAPEMLCPKIRAIGGPAVLPESEDSPIIAVPTEKGLILVTRPKKDGAKKWDSAKIKCDLPAESCSVYTAPSGENLLVCGMNHTFALLTYRLKKNKLTVGRAILPYKESEIRAVQSAGEVAEDDSADKKKSGKKLNLPINLSAVAAITIALVSAGIGILMGLTAGKEEKPKK